MLKKLVNGLEVIMSDEEEAAVRAEWAANDTKTASDAPVLSAKKTQIASLKQRIKVLANQSDLTAAEVKEALMKFIKLKLLQDELE